MNGLSNIQEYGRLYVIQMERKLRLNLLRWHMICWSKISVLSDTGIVCNTSGRRITEMAKIYVRLTLLPARSKKWYGSISQMYAGTSGMKLENFIRLWEDNYEQINHDGTSSK